MWQVIDSLTNTVYDEYATEYEATIVAEELNWYACYPRYWVDFELGGPMYYDD